MPENSKPEQRWNRVDKADLTQLVYRVALMKSALNPASLLGGNAEHKLQSGTSSLIGG
jgi:hypothetical protein